LSIILRYDFSLRKCSSKVLSFGNQLWVQYRNCVGDLPLPLQFRAIFTSPDRVVRLVQCILPPCICICTCIVDLFKVPWYGLNNAFSLNFPDITINDWTISQCRRRRTEHPACYYSWIAIRLLCQLREHFRRVMVWNRNTDRL
jgi:hypothetical protein